MRFARGGRFVWSVFLLVVLGALLVWRGVRLVNRMSDSKASAPARSDTPHAIAVSDEDRLALNRAPGGPAIMRDISFVDTMVGVYGEERAAREMCNDASRKKQAADFARVRRDGDAAAKLAVDHVEATVARFCSAVDEAGAIANPAALVPSP